MFLQVFVCPRGVSVSVQQGLHPGILCPGGVSVQGVSVQGVSVHGVYLSIACICPGDLCPGVVPVQGVSVQGGLCQGDFLHGNEQVLGILLECILVMYANMQNVCRFVQCLHHLNYY